VASLFINLFKTTKTMKKTGLTIRIEDMLRERLVEVAESKNQTVSEYVRELLWDKHFIIM
jgi:predicted DNA-binding protein